MRFFCSCLIWFLLTSTACAEEGLLGHWQFTADHIDKNSVKALAGPLDPTVKGVVKFSAEAPKALLFDGGKSRYHVEVTSDSAKSPLPKKTLTLEAWVLVEKPIEWGGFVNVIQDNGSYEKGWILGYSHHQFYFGLATAKANKLTYLKGDRHYCPGCWYHVVGTYDGIVQRLYVDGRLQTESREQSGDIAYPPRSVYSIGAYQDADEFYGLAGQIESVAVFDRALTPEQIADRFQKRKKIFPFIDPVKPDVRDWPTQMRDMQRTGMSDETLTFPLHLQWTYKARYAPQPAWPAPAQHDYWHKKHNLEEPTITYDRAFHVVGVGDNVFFGSSADDKVYCLDAHTGQERWSFFAEGPVRLAPTVVDQRLVFGSDDGFAYCVNVKDGSLVWKQRQAANARRIPGNGRAISFQPVRTDVLVEGGKGFLCAGVFPSWGVAQNTLDLKDGRNLESVPLTVTAQGYLERVGGQLRVPTGRDPAGAFVAKLQRRTKDVGKEVKAIPTEYPFAFIGAGEVRFGGGDGKLAAFRIKDGAKIWSAEVEGKVHSLAVVRGRLLVGTDRGHIYCFANTDAVAKVIEPAKPAPLTYSDAAMRERHEKAAEWMVKQVGVMKGYCLLLGSGEGHLAYELGRRTSWQIVVREPDETKIARVRKVLDAAGLSGRVSIHHGTLTDLPYTDYMFNAIASESLVNGEPFPGKKTEVLRVLRPCGGTAIFGLKESELVRREPLKGAGEWSHMYADTGNTACSQDSLVEGELQLQWFGQPGPRPMIDRHHRTAPPLYKNGRMFIPGDDRVFGIDAYNGTILWEVAVPQSRRVAAFRDCSYLAITEDRVHVVAADKCLILDAQTGTTEKTFHIPDSLCKDKGEWGYVAVVGEVLVGSAVKPGSSRRTQSYEVAATEAYWDQVPIVCSQALFGLSRDKGASLWTYTPQEGMILNPTIAIADNVVYFLESRNPETLKASLGRGKLAELLSKGADMVAVEVRSGKVLWRKPQEAVKNLQHNVYLSVAHGHILVVGSRNSGTDKNKSTVLFDLHVFNAKTGEKKWTKTQNQFLKIGGDHGEQDTHPVIVGDKLYLEPSAYQLETGEPIGWKWPWGVKRRGGCGTLSASAVGFFFRDSNISMFDARSGQVKKVTTETRPGCWINLIPAGGLLLAPEASSGCTCNYSVQTSLALIPVKR